MKSQLVRPKEGRMVAGVCVGLADYFNIDVVIIRLIFVLLLLSGGAGILAYIILLIIIPEESGSSYAKTFKGGINDKEKEHIKKDIKDSAEQMKKAIKDGRGNTLLAYFLIILGIGLLSGNLFPFLAFTKIWPMYLIIIGIIILSTIKKEE